MDTFASQTKLSFVVSDFQDALLQLSYYHLILTCVQTNSIQNIRISKKKLELPKFYV